MLRVLARRGGAVMAGVTGTWRNITMIKHRGRPAIGAMTVITLVTTGDMGGGFSCCDRAIVATEAGANDLSMVYAINRSPICCGVAILTNVCGLDVGRVLTGCNRAIMAACTSAQHLIMVDRRNR